MNLVLKSILAGVCISLGAAFMLVIKADVTLSAGISAVLAGLCFSLGLFLVVCTGASLFTGNCLRVGSPGLVKLLGCSFVFNMIACFIMACLFTLCHFAFTDAAQAIAETKCNQSWLMIMAKGIICNALVCLGVWISSDAKTITGKFVAVAVPVTAFVALGAEHCIANGFLFSYSALTGGLTDGMVTNLVFSTVGNLIGGIAVGLVKNTIKDARYGYQSK